jgi:ssDNA-binding replication factor A large subunit
MSEKSGYTASGNATADRATCPTCGRPNSAQGPVGIGSLKPNTSATLEATVASIGPVRHVVTSRGPAEVADAMLQDGSGAVKFVLWNDQIVKYSTGSRVRLSGAWVREYRGHLQVSLGRDGSAVILGP